MSREDRQSELGEKTRQLLQGSLKHVRAATLAAVLVPLASVATVSPAMAQSGTGLCFSGGCTCPASSGQTGVPYSSMLGVTNPNAIPPFMFSIISGALPPGLSLDPTTGFITGTPTTAGTFDFTWQVQDSTGATGTLMCSIIITTLSAAVPSPCDFITGGGFVFTNTGARANFGSHGGCKNGAFWGHVNYVDHGGSAGALPYHVDSTQITAYGEDPAFPNARDICGCARTNAGEIVQFRVRMEDNGEPGTNDTFGIVLSNGYILTSRLLGTSGPGGGNIQLHKPNPSTTVPTSPPDCGGLPTPLPPPPMP